MSQGDATQAPLAGPPRRRAGHLGFVLRLCGAVAGILLAGEVAARVLPPPRERTPFVEDPVVVARLRPSWAGGHVRINPQGLRDEQPVGEKAPGERRILFLGDSLLYANELPFAQTFPEQLETLLGPGVRSLNSGVPSYTTLHERLLLERLAPALKPDVVVLVVSIGTDLGELLLVPHGFDGVRRHIELVGPEQAMSVVEEPAKPERFNASKALAEVSLLWRRIKNSRLYQQLRPKGRTRGRAADGQPVALDPETFRQRKVASLAPLRRGASERPPLSDAWARFEAELTAMRRTAESVGATVLVAGVPEELQVDDALLREVAARAQPPLDPEALDLGQPQRRCAAACERAGVTWLDLLPPLRACEKQPVFLPGSAHLGADGHEVVARELARVLERSP